MKSETFLIGPNPCHTCGGEYGEHDEELHQRFDPPKRPDRATELGQLERAVIEAAKKWRAGDEYVLNRPTKSLIRAVDALIEKEANEKS